MHVSQHSTVCRYSRRLPTLHMPSHTSAHSHFIIIIIKITLHGPKIGAGGDDNQLIILTWPNILQTSRLEFWQDRWNSKKERNITDHKFGEMVELCKKKRINASRYEQNKNYEAPLIEEQEVGSRVHAVGAFGHKGTHCTDTSHEKAFIGTKFCKSTLPWFFAMNML